MAKLQPDGKAILYCGYIGGSGWDVGSRITVDDLGHAYVTGETFSDETTAPVVQGPDLTYNGRGDAFVAKVAVDGSYLVYFGYIGGSEPDAGTGIVLDSSGCAWGCWGNSVARGKLPFGRDWRRNFQRRD